MSEIGSYSGKKINSQAAVAPTLDLSGVFSHDYSGKVDYENKAITQNKETSLDLSVFIDEDIEKGENVLTANRNQDRGSTEIDKNIEAGENILQSETKKKTESIVIQEVKTEAPKKEKNGGKKVWIF